MTAGALLVSLPLLAWLGRREGARPAFRWVLRVFLSGLALVFWVNLPLGPEDRVVRRQPWATWTIVGLCVAVFQLQLVEVRGRPGRGPPLPRPADEADHRRRRGCSSPRAGTPA